MDVQKRFYKKIRFRIDGGTADCYTLAPMNHQFLNNLSLTLLGLLALTGRGARAFG